MSGTLAQMAANNSSGMYEVPGGVSMQQPAGGEGSRVPLPPADGGKVQPYGTIESTPSVFGGRRRRNKKSRKHTKKHKKSRRHHRK